MTLCFDYQIVNFFIPTNKKMGAKHIWLNVMSADGYVELLNTLFDLAGIERDYLNIHDALDQVRQIFTKSKKKKSMFVNPSSSFPFSFIDLFS